MKQLTPLQLDALKELASVGSGHAASGLSTMLGKRINIAVPKVQVLPFGQVADCLGGAEQIFCAIIFRLVGGTAGSVLMMFTNESSARLLNLLLGRQKPALGGLDEYEESALKELCNISTGAYLVALSELTGLTLVHSTPALAIDMLGAVLDEVMILQAEEAGQAIIIETEFSIGAGVVTGYLLFVPDVAGMQKILKKLGVNS